MTFSNYSSTSLSNYTFSIIVQWLFEKNKLEQCYTRFISLPGYHRHDHPPIMSTNPEDKVLCSSFTDILMSGESTGYAGDPNATLHSHYLEKRYILES